MILESHFFSLVIYALLVSLVLSLIRRNDRKARIKHFISLFLIMVLGAFLFGWFMYLFL